MDLEVFSDERNCNVCGKKTNGFNYGVQSCNACKMFYRRAIATHKTLACKKQRNCSTIVLENGKSQCRYCRFHKCVLAGMNLLIIEPKSPKPDVPTDMIGKLELLNSMRKNTFLNCKTSSNLTVNDIFTRGNFNFDLKTPETVFDFYDWGVMNHLTCISFAKKLDFMKYLSSEDIKSIFKYSHLMTMILVTAMRSYSFGMDFMCHPDGTDIFPKEVQSASGYNHKFLNEIRCLLIGRLIELKITEEEFLLLSAIILCNPAAPNLSESGKILLSSNQKMYSSTLLRYCLLKNTNDGPSRFTEILSLCHVISKTHSDIDHFSSLFPIVQPEHVQTNLFTQILSFLLA